MEKNDEVEKFIICYKSGEQKVIDKGFFCEMKEDQEGVNLSFTLCDVSGKELEHIVFGCLELGIKLGMFDKKEE